MGKTSSTLLASLRDQIACRGMAFTTSMITDQEAFYDLRADVYDSQNEIPHRIARRKRVQTIYHDFLEPRLRGRKISYLDFGCGTGVATAEFVSGLSEYCSIIEARACDVSEEMINRARPRLPSFELIRGSYDVLTGRFDLISAFFHVLCHLDDNELAAFFSKMAQLLNPGGLLIFDVIAQFNVGEHGYTKDDSDHSRKYLCYQSLDKDGNPIRDRNGLLMVGTDRLFSRRDIEDLPAASGLYPAEVAEIEVDNPDPKVGSLREYVIVLKL